MTGKFSNDSFSLLIRHLPPGALPAAADFHGAGAGATARQDGRVSRFGRELALRLRLRLAALALAALALLSAGAVVNGLRVVDQQHAQLARAVAAHDAEVAGAAQRPGPASGAGAAADVAAHLALNPAAPLAFAALGNLDLQPSALRIRVLGLHAQVYESESVNAEPAVARRFDFAFVLVYLAPLLMIALAHELTVGKRAAGRLGVRFAQALAACVLPFAAGALWSGAPGGALAALAAAAALYLGFWLGLGAWIGARARSPAAGAASLLACLVVLTMILPAIAGTVIARLLPEAREVELALAQRQAVPPDWDLPKAQVKARMFQGRPERRDGAPAGERFRWRWYFAMNQVADEALGGQLAANRACLAARERWSERAGWLLAAVDVQLLLHRLAQTDLQAQLALYDRIAVFRARLRRAYFPSIFNERPLGGDAAGMARFDPPAELPALPAGPLANLALLASLALALGVRQLRR